MKQEFPFVSRRLEEERVKDKRKIFTVSLNLEEISFLLGKETKRLIQQEKDGTVIKQLATIGAKYIHSQQIGPILDIIQSNKRKNKRLGLVEFE